MARTDMILSDLVDYRPDVREPGDFDSFWDVTVTEARRWDLAVEVTEVTTPYRTVRVRDVSFAGFGGDRVSAWFTVPIGFEGPLPAVVEFVGYGGGRGLAGEALTWASAGYAHLLVDCRGQESSWGNAVPHPDPFSTGPGTSGFMTRGIHDPHSYYYRRVFTDAVRSTEAVRALPGVDAKRVAVTGLSQGGGISLAVAGLVHDLVAVMPDVPFLCHFERAVDVCEKDPFAELTRHLSVHRDQVDAVFTTLSYFDAVNFAKRARSHAYFSVALMDTVCPPSTVYAAFNHYTGAKEIVNYAFNDHEGGRAYQRQAQLRWLADTLEAK